MSEQRILLIEDEPDLLRPFLNQSSQPAFGSGNPAANLHDGRLLKQTSAFVTAFKYFGSVPDTQHWLIYSRKCQGCWNASPLG
jgi:hypothetical protein